MTVTTGTAAKPKNKAWYLLRSDGAVFLFAKELHVRPDMRLINWKQAETMTGTDEGAKAALVKSYFGELSTFKPRVYREPQNSAPTEKDLQFEKDRSAQMAAVQVAEEEERMATLAQEAATLEAQATLAAQAAQKPPAGPEPVQAPETFPVPEIEVEDVDPPVSPTKIFSKEWVYARTRREVADLLVTEFEYHATQTDTKRQLQDKLLELQTSARA